MNKYKSFSDFALAQIKNLTEIAQNTVVRASAIIIAGEIKKRVENGGADSDGVAIVSKSPQRFGAYSKSWGAFRQSKGRQTAKVDLNFTGQMWRDWRPVPTANGWGATFVTKESMQKAFENQQIFETEIFSPTTTEVNIGNDAMTRRVQKILKRK